MILLWVVLGSILGSFASYVRDYIDSDAGRYTHLALAIARTGSLVPRVNGVDIHSYSQLYPMLMAPFFIFGTMATELHLIAVEGAYIMSSACIPAYLLTKRVTSLRWAPLVVGVLAVCMPWIVTSMFLMTEVAAYPASVWALFALVVAISAPSKKHDLLALLAIAVAFLARGELIVLLIVLPLALATFELGRAPSAGLRARVAAAGRSLVRGHVILVAVYTVAGVAALALYLQQRLSSILGVYSVYSNSAHLAYGRLPRSLAEHLATFSLGVGVVPFVVALAWIGANVIRPSATREAHAFACVSTFMVVLVFMQATNFDLVVNSYVHDRFLMYFVPVVLVGVVLAVTDERKPRWSLILPLCLIVAGFAWGEIPVVAWGQFDWLDLDTPISTVYRVLALNSGGLSAAREELIAFTLVGTTLFVVGARRLRSRIFVVAVLAFCGVTMTLATAAVFARTFDQPDSNSRYVTQSQHGILDWVDEDLGPNASVTAISYPLSSDWFVNAEAWSDLEWFNKTIVRDATVEGGQDPFDYLGNIWFPKIGLSFDENTGAVDESPTRWVLQSQKETRFRIDGTDTVGPDGVALIDAGKSWRLAWLTAGLYDDGWTRPGVPVRMRVYSTVGQKRAELRSVAFIFRSAGASLSFELTSGRRSTRGTATGADTFQTIEVCVPAHGFGQVRFAVHGSSAIPGDLATYNESVLPRQGGVVIASLSVADEIGGACKPASS